MPMSDDDPTTVSPSIGGPSPTSAAPSRTPNLMNCSMAGSSDFDDFQSLGVTMDEAEVLLDRWRRLMAHAIPFVIIPSDITARRLYSVKPLLLHAIVTVTYFHNLRKQQLMVRQLMRDISERILINNEKNVGILQGLLVFITWYHPHIFWGQQVTNLLHLAIAMVIDMGIDRNPASCFGAEFKGATTKAVHGPALIQRAPTLEEHRILAGVFYLTSMLSSSFKKINAFPYSKYLEECLHNLVRAREYDSDLLLVQLVRLQHLAEDAHTVENPSAPVQIYIKAYEADLKKLKDDDPCENMPENMLLKMQYLNTEILFWELSLNELQENQAANLKSHLDDLYRLINATKSFIDLYFTLPLSSYLTIPFSVFGQFAHAFIVLTKLASLEVEGWDVVRTQTLDFGNIIETAAFKLEESVKSSPDGLQIQNDGFKKWASRVRWMKQVYEAKFMQPPDMNPSQTQDKPDTERNAFPETYIEVSTPGIQQPTPPDDILSADFFNYLDEGFWNSFNTQYDLGFPDITMSAIS
ncbi:hypothetical protein M433DRAFT_326566 [Acidomyces richmondensis BFW]|nr:MAG: hypothetical protein FE78DRAFT_464671 [Acidomyces sp. 'richmondensis']KYG43941.1 hypothetical protein M433DRAFT_326566 [Acidomyces richmondensis BFW]